MSTGPFNWFRRKKELPKNDDSHQQERQSKDHGVGGSAVMLPNTTTRSQHRVERDGRSSSAAVQVFPSNNLPAVPKEKNDIMVIDLTIVDDDNQEEEYTVGPTRNDNPPSSSSSAAARTSKVDDHDPSITQHNGRDGTAPERPRHDAEVHEDYETASGEEEEEDVASPTTRKELASSSSSAARAHDSRDGPAPKRPRHEHDEDQDNDDDPDDGIDDDYVADEEEDADDENEDDGEEEPPPPRHFIGANICKRFNDGKWYHGRIVSGPEMVHDRQRNLGLVPVWRVRYDADGQEEDLSERQLRRWWRRRADDGSSSSSTTTKKKKVMILVDGEEEEGTTRPANNAVTRWPSRSSRGQAKKKMNRPARNVASLPETTPLRGFSAKEARRPVKRTLHEHDEEDDEDEEILRRGGQIGTKTESASRSCYDYDRAKKDLSYFAGITEEEIIAALDEMQPPYDYNNAVDRIHQAKYRAGNPVAGGVLRQEPPFVPHLGMKVRKMYSGVTYNGVVTGHNDDIDDGYGKQVDMWEVTFDDGDKEDFDFSELFAIRACRPNRPLRGRQFCSLELFSGRGIITQQFVELKWSVRSVDSSPNSFATDKVDFHQLQWSNIGAVPDFIWASPPCFTYSLLAGGKHRNSAQGKYAMTEEAREHDRLLLKLGFLLNWCLAKNPHAIIVIENPEALLRRMPIMRQIGSELSLDRATVHYCAFGRHDKKPTNLWTNNDDLYCKLNTFRCTEETCSFCLSQHAGVRNYGQLYDAAAIPDALAEYIANHVHATLFLKNLGLKEQATVTAAEEETFNDRMAA